MTSIKPSGTVSLLAGATPGVHFPHSRHYIRRVRLGKHSNLLKPLLEAGYPVEEDQMDKTNSLVVEIPVSLGKNIRTLNEVSLWEQLEVASLLQRYWADNQVSCTVTFDPKTEGSQLKHALDYHQYHLKGISFLPHVPNIYPQMPYEEITGAEYHERASKLRNLNLNGDSEQIILRVRDDNVEDPKAENYCDSDTCKI